MAKNLLREISPVDSSVLETFRSAAKGDLTIFDLANAPAGWSYLKKYGDLILFARKQRWDVLANVGLEFSD